MISHFSQRRARVVKKARLGGASRDLSSAMTILEGAACGRTVVIVPLFGTLHRDASNLTAIVRENRTAGGAAKRRRRVWRGDGHISVLIADQVARDRPFNHGPRTHNAEQRMDSL